MAEFKCNTCALVIDDGALTAKMGFSSTYKAQIIGVK